MDTGRFKMVDPEQLVEHERRREKAAETTRQQQRRSARRTRVAGSHARVSSGSGHARTSESTKTTGSRGRSRTPQNAPEAQRRRFPVVRILLAAAAILIIAFAVQLCSSASPITVTVNGTQHTVRGEKNLQAAIKESGLPLNPGDFISLQGNVLRRHEGHPFTADVNGTETNDPNLSLHDGDVITLTDGKDIVEDYDAVEEPVPHEASIVGTGSIHTFTPGADGVKEIRTGRESGEVVEKQTVDPQDLVETRTDIGVGNDKVIALTFDDGPSTVFTSEFLDILSQNDAKATFFCMGTAVEFGGAELVKRAADQGCQICTHSYNNARTADGDFSLLTPEEQVQEMQMGYQSLSDVLGYEPSHYVRVGSEDMKLDVVPNIAPLIDAEIGWTVDTGDWVYMTEDDIFNTLMSAKAGDIIRMHDGGDHQDVTAAALKKALPKLKEKGFTFITIDELMAYRSPDEQ